MNFLVCGTKQVYRFKRNLVKVVGNLLNLGKPRKGRKLVHQGFQRVDFLENNSRRLIESTIIRYLFQIPTTKALN